MANKFKKDQVVRVRSDALAYVGHGPPSTHRGKAGTIVSVLGNNQYYDYDVMLNGYPASFCEEELEIAEA